MKRIFWMGIGVAVGVLAVRRISQVRSAVGPEGLNRAVGRLSDSIADFADAVRSGMAERETDLRQALGMDEDAVPSGARPPAALPAGAVTPGLPSGAVDSRR